MRISRRPKTNPGLWVFTPFAPKPPHAKSRGKLLEVEDAKATKLFRLANHFPIDLTLPSGDLVTRGPKKRSSYTIYLHEDLHRDVKHSGKINDNSCKHRLDKGAPTGHSDMLSHVRNKLGGHFVF
jgi:hypothetical protein